VKRLLIPLVIYACLVTGCGYSPLRLPAAVSGKPPAGSVKVEARLLGEDEWDSGTSDHVFAVHVSVMNGLEEAVDFEPWDFILSSTRIGVHPLPPLRAAMMTSWRHRPVNYDSYGLIRLLLLGLWAPAEHLSLSMQGGPNRERIADFGNNALEARRLLPGERVSGILFYEEDPAPETELAWRLWNSSGVSAANGTVVLKEGAR